jgi:hypothetical protein
VVSPEFVEEPKQILPLTTPELHPKEQRSLFGAPELKDPSGTRIAISNWNPNLARLPTHPSGLPKPIVIFSMISAGKNGE